MTVFIYLFIYLFLFLGRDISKTA